MLLLHFGLKTSNKDVTGLPFSREFTELNPVLACQMRGGYCDVIVALWNEDIWEGCGWPAILAQVN